MKKKDEINTPQHYLQGSIEPIDFIESNNMDHCEGCIVKYITRYKYKGNAVDDIKKLIWYANRILKKLEK